LVDAISGIAFTTPVAVSADGVFTCAVEFRGEPGYPFTADVEFEVGDDLVTRMSQVDERTGGDAASVVRGSVGCGVPEVAPGDYEAVNDANGADQTYWTVVPESYSADDPLPVYLLLASGNGNADQNFAAWRPLIGDPEGLFVVAGTELDAEFEVDTYVGLIDQIGANYCVDLDHIHVIGSSRSAALAAKLMCQMPETFASFADSVGTFGRLSSCEPTPKALVAMTGDTDRPQVTVSVGAWAAINNCDTDPQAEDLGSGITRYTYEGCDEDTVLYDFEGMGHQLPATECIGPAGRYCAEYEDFDAFDTWGQFFAEHPLC
jgi:polyhydroxybutyrate depolymerase